MSDRYRGPATFRTTTGVFAVDADLFTDTSEGLYSWGGRATTLDLRALDARDGTLVLPDDTAGEVHVAVAEIAAGASGVLLRLHGSGRAPYERDGATAYERTQP